MFVFRCRQIKENALCLPYNPFKRNMVPKSALKNINYTRIGYHILFWIVITVFYDGLSAATSSRQFSETLLLDLLFYTPTDILGVYFTIYFLMPRFLYKKKIWQFSVWFLIFFAALILLIALPLEYLGWHLLLTDYFAEKGREFPSYWHFFERNIAWGITIKLMIIGLVSSVKFMKRWVSSQKHEQLLMKEKLETELKLKEAELKFLKSQINPHFLFNALNNLYSLTLEKSDLAPKIVLKISSLLDYMLYECNEPFTDLEKETESIRDYVDLQKIRYGDKVDVQLNISESIEDEKIAPLLLLPFVENAFKHGLDKNVGEGYVHIDMLTENNCFVFRTKNSMSYAEQEGNSGIGLKNVKKRLQLQYPDNYSLKIDEQENCFLAELTINLQNSHNGIPVDEIQD